MIEWCAVQAEPWKNEFWNRTFIGSRDGPCVCFVARTTVHPAVRTLLMQSSYFVRCTNNFSVLVMAPRSYFEPPVLSFW